MDKALLVMNCVRAPHTTPIRGLCLLHILNLTSLLLTRFEEKEFESLYPLIEKDKFFPKDAHLICRLFVSTLLLQYLPQYRKQDVRILNFNSTIPRGAAQPWIHYQLLKKVSIAEFFPHLVRH